MTDARRFLIASLLAAGCSHAQQTPDRAPNSAVVQQEKAAAAQEAAFNSLKRGDLKAAAAQWSDALRIRPDDPYTLSNLGLVDDALGRREDALLHTARATQLNPNSPALAVNNGVVLERNGLGAQAIGQYRRALELDPKFEPALMALGIRALSAREYAEAERQFKAALRFHPRHAAYAGLAAIAAAQRDWHRAATLMEAARERNPNHAIYAAAAGALFYRDNQWAKADKALEAALRLDPKQGDALVLAAELAWREHNYRASQTYLEEAARVDTPGLLLAGTLLRKGELAFTLDQPQLVKQTLSFAMSQKGQPADWRGRAHAILGTLAIRRHDFANAEEEFAKAVKLSGETAFITAGLAAARHGLALTGPMDKRLERLGEAERLYRRSLDMSENARLRLSLARLYLELTDLVDAPYRRGKQRLAEIQLREALKHNPGMVEGHVRLALLLDTLGRPTEALASYQQALKLDPGATRVQFLYANLLRRLGEKQNDPALRQAAHESFATIMREDAHYVPAQIGWYVTRTTAETSQPVDSKEKTKNPHAKKSPHGPGAPGDTTDETIIVTPFPGGETEGVPPALEDLLPFLGPGDEGIEENPLPEGVIPIKQGDRNPIYSIDGTGPTHLTPAVY